MSQPAPRIQTLLSVYAVERADNRAGLQVLLGLVTAGLAYVVPATALGATHCTKIVIAHAGCRGLPPLVRWAAPLPALSLYAFLVANQVTLERGGTYLKALEREIFELTEGRDSGTDVLVPQGATIIVSQAYGERPFVLVAVISQVGGFLTAFGFTVAAVLLMPWDKYQDHWVFSLMFSVFYVTYWVVTGWSLGVIAWQHRPATAWLPWRSVQAKDITVAGWIDPPKSPKQ